MANASLSEKTTPIVIKSEASSSGENAFYDEALVEPRKEESLHRGLKARQISMIAVCIAQ
jgi:yeast amino acid transporter